MIEPIPKEEFGLKLKNESVAHTFRSALRGWPDALRYNRKTMQPKAFRGWLAAALTIATAALLTASMEATTSRQQPAVPLRTFTPEEIAAMAATLPEGPGRELTVKVCAQCHEPQRAGSLRLTREGWGDVVTKMVGLGARASDTELEQITEYLATNFKGEAPKPINMNSASSVELESVAGLLRKEAAIWIAYRNKNPPCKALDDLKKVAGLPFKKIDERRDRLVCF
jgi:competence protein ComEA